MDAIFILSTVFFVLALTAPIYYLWNNKRKKPTSEKIISDMEIRNDEYLQRQYSAWERNGKIVHPIKYVNGGISRLEVKRLEKGIHPIRHTHLKLMS